MSVTKICCGITEPCLHSRSRKIVIVGAPNVGKSVLFNKLTGRYVTVSNYPGTTVEIANGRTHIDGVSFEVIDTPGMYTLLPITEEEKVARDLLIREKPSVVLHVVEARNLERMLPLTLQLIEAGLPVILVLNMMDEAQRDGMRFDLQQLEGQLSVAVVATISTKGQGIEHLKKRIKEIAESHRE